MNHISCRLPPERAVFAACAPTTQERWRRHLLQALQALGTGASAVPLGDNGEIIRELARRFTCARE